MIENQSKHDRKIATTAQDTRKIEEKRSIDSTGIG